MFQFAIGAEEECLIKIRDYGEGSLFNHQLQRKKKYFIQETQDIAKYLKKLDKNMDLLT